MALYGPVSSATPALLATSADLTNTLALNAGTVYQYPIATTAAGTATTYTVTTAGVYQIGMMVAVTTTMPSLAGISYYGSTTGVPYDAGTAGSGLTGAPTFPSTIPTETRTVYTPYFWLT
jgi:hypothetical protein